VRAYKDLCGGLKACRNSSPRPAANRAPRLTYCSSSTGDLALRKLVPALLSQTSGRQSGRALVSGCGQDQPESRSLYCADERRVAVFKAEEFSAERWKSFAALWTTSRLTRRSPRISRSFRRCSRAARTSSESFPVDGPSLLPTCNHLAASGSSPPSRASCWKSRWARTAFRGAINRSVGAIFGEHQIYRIDHYLGKETVQNLIALRFGNTLFEPLWRRGRIRHVQITVASSWGSKVVASSTIRPALCATWSRAIFYNSSASWRWSHRRAAIQTPFATRS